MAPPDDYDLGREIGSINTRLECVHDIKADLEKMPAKIASAIAAHAAACKADREATFEKRVGWIDRAKLAAIFLAGVLIAAGVGGTGAITAVRRLLGV